MLKRRNFIKETSKITAAASSTFLFPHLVNATSTPINDSLNFVGPKKGYTPQIGTLVSMMNWMRETILWPVRDMSIKELDYLIDNNANSIGAMLLHLAATERFYQLNTFDGRKWGDWPKKDDEMYSVAMSLGNRGRKKIKGNPLDFYLEKLMTVRENSLKELAKRDDEWLLKIDPNWGWSHPTNNYCKWFHVVEH
ncbi:MAG: hypothetical protein AAGJ18_22495, partial [Bacteroidota bacterium]